MTFDGATHGRATLYRRHAAEGSGATADLSEFVIDATGQRHTLTAKRPFASVINHAWAV